MVKKTKNGFIKGAFILMLFGFLSKVVGAIYRIPLTGILGAEGMGLYQMVFPLYSLLLTISSSGLPSSISKLISECHAKHDYRQAGRILRVSFVLLVSFSLICSLIVVFGSRLFAGIQGNKQAAICYLGLSPAIVFVGLISGFRGYFQGIQLMTPSAISGFIEQVFKLGAGLYLSSLFIKRGLSFGVLGALIGISISEIAAFVYLLLRYLFAAKTRRELLKTDSGNILSYSKTAGQILSLSFFVTLGGLIMPITMLIDSVVTINILKKIGFSVQDATSLFGLESGLVGSIVNMPVVLSLSVATAILPCVSMHRARGDFDGVKREASRAVWLTLILALPATVGCFAFARPIITLLYAKSLTAAEIKVAAGLLELASISIFYLALLQVCSGLLQGLGRFKVPVIALAAGGVVKVVLNVALIFVPSINILGAEVANSMCYATALIINLSVLKRQGVIELDKKIFIVLLLCVGVYASKFLFEFLLKTNLNFYMSLFVTIGLVVVLYFFFMALFFKKKPVKVKK